MNNKKCKKWTVEEEDILIKCIKASPFKMANAYVEASKVINRTPVACANRWAKIKDKPEVGVTFLTIADKEYLKNRKISNSRTTVQRMESNIWSKIKRLLGLN